MNQKIIKREIGDSLKWLQDITPSEELKGY